MWGFARGSIDVVSVCSNSYKCILIRANSYQNFQFNFPNWNLSHDWELAQNQLDTVGHSWTQLDTVGFSWIQLDFFPTHFRPNWTRLDFFPTRQNWFQLDICWEIKFPIGNILRGEIYNWKKQNPTNSNSLKPNQLSPTEFPIGLSWSKILFQLEIQYSNINQLTPTQSNSFQLDFQLDFQLEWVGNFGKGTNWNVEKTLWSLHGSPQHHALT